MCLILLACTGGWNNNPNAIQFQTVFRRLLTRCGIKAGLSGNVVPQDNTSFVCLTRDDQPVSDSEAVSPFEDNHIILHDHDYMSPSINALVQNTVVYIAGWAVRKALRSLSCDVCRAALVTSHQPDFSGAYHLLTLKNNGGLFVPSEGVVKVLMVAEKRVRLLSSVCRASNNVTSLQVITAVCDAVGSNDVFDLGDHITDTQHGIDNHHYKTMRVLVEIYVDLRLHHIAKLHTIRLHNSSVRHKLTKTILFKGQ